VIYSCENFINEKLIGSKASNLQKLYLEKFNVPKFIVLDNETLEKIEREDSTELELVENYIEEEKTDKIYANIYCETQSQKGILIGKGGGLLKLIGTQSRIDLEQITEKKVYLELKVKVEKNWRKKDSALKRFGYKTETRR